MNFSNYLCFYLGQYLHQYFTKLNEKEEFVCKEIERKNVLGEEWWKWHPIEKNVFS